MTHDSTRSTRSTRSQYIPTFFQKHGVLGCAKKARNKQKDSVTASRSRMKRRHNCSCFTMTRLSCRTCQYTEPASVATRAERGASASKSARCAFYAARLSHNQPGIMLRASTTESRATYIPLVPVLLPSAAAQCHC